ncbi:p450 domain containing protein, partial [Asbolus verrucosus]
MWPPGFQTDRRCTKNYVIEPIKPKEKVVFVEKGSSVLVPIIGLHRDPQYYQEPHRFDPERFSDENKPKIVPGTYLPFGIGPRNCIGSRFALLEIKTLFFHLMSKFILVPVDETEIPLKISPKRSVVHEPSWPIIGNMGSSLLRKKHMMDIIMDLYKKYPNERYVGYMQFTRPLLLLRDLDLIKQIGVKDFDHFHDHFSFANTDKDPLLSKSLISLSGENWRQMRATLSPAFTSSKMKNMYQLIADCAENFAGHFKGKERVAVEMKDIFSRFATDVIATTAFGIKIDSLDQPNNNFFKMGGRLGKFGVVVFLKIVIMHLSSTLSNLLGIQLFPKDVTNFFRTIIKDSIAKRENEGIVRQDLIHLLMEARKGQLKHETAKDAEDEGFATVEESHIGKNNTQMNLTDEHIVAQAMLFFFAGFDTASTTSAFMAHELAVNPDIHKKLQEEIDAVNQKYQTKVPYEALLSMKYLDQVICETLRLWPPGFQTDRVCTKDYQILPKNLKEKTVLIEKGVSVLIPVMALHRDPQYYPEPDRFDPDRFSDENKSKILPGTYLPFGIGPRNCIGSRFAILEIKTLFFHLLSKFDIVAINDTQIPLEISPKKIVLAPEKGFKL